MPRTRVERELRGYRVYKKFKAKPQGLKPSIKVMGLSQR
jgi:hypothetical protein